MRAEHAVLPLAGHSLASAVMFRGRGGVGGAPTPLLVSCAVAEWLSGQSTAPAGLPVLEDTASSDHAA